MKKLLLAILTCFLLSGCTSTISSYYTDDSEVFCANGAKARLKVTDKQFVMILWSKVQWTKGGIFAKKYNLSNIIEKYTPYIEDSYGHDISDIHGYDAVKKEYEDYFNTQLSKNPQIKKQTAEASKWYQIVCLDPLVVLVQDRKAIAWKDPVIYIECALQSDDGEIIYMKQCFMLKIINWNRKRFDGDFELIPYSQPPDSKSFIALPGGVHHGNTFPYRPGMKWFSPDMKIKDQPVEMISETKGRIKVPWGYLHLTKQNENWVVTAEKK